MQGEGKQPRREGGEVHVAWMQHSLAQEELDALKGYFTQVI